LKVAPAKGNQLIRFASLLLTAAAALAQIKVPRPAPDFLLVEPSGRTAKLSSYRGQVVLLAFVLTTCPHCQAASRDFEKLQREFAPRGFRVMEVAFDEGANVAAYSQRLAITFPVGRGERSQVLEFLGIPHNVRIGTPQVVLIDRAGWIRAQSAREGSPLLQSAEVLRGLIDNLLRRPANP
jgi:peroxiredoxin